MTTLPPPVAPVVESQSSLWLSIIEEALNAIPFGGTVGAGIKLTAALVQIIIHAKQGYEAQSGQPLDLTKIPFEEPVP